MHLEVLVEDQSGKKALEILLPELLGDAHTFRVKHYKGIGHIPKDMETTQDPSKRMLLAQLPKILEGLGKTFSNYPNDYHTAVVVVCDLDDRCMKQFRNELLSILEACNPKPEARFCFAIEEGEAWFLGDINAIKSAYPKANNQVLNSYKNDEICGTWELLAEAIYPGGVKALKEGNDNVGWVKSKWAENITPNMDVENNQSPSFNYFKDKLHELTGS